MPLIIITGTPCSGKTFRAQQIAQEFSRRLESQPDQKRSIIYIPSHHATLDPPAGDSNYVVPNATSSPREIIYDSAKLEKTARAEEFSAAKRAVSKTAVVIVDAPNYIKGFRYQLYCEAKAAGTRSIVVHAAAREEECVAWNNARLEAWNWPREDQDVQVAQGPKIGRDVFGDLQPESHTAGYGDLGVNVPKSRSSSMGADSDDAPRPRPEDTMTLKSLYISDTRPAEPTARLPRLQEAEKPYELPSSTPPDAKTSLPYSPKAFKSLFMRYEPPSPFSRWDTPLFIIPSEDAHPPYDDMWAAIFPGPSKPTKKELRRQEEEAVEKKMQARGQEKADDVRQNASTMLPVATAPNALQVLEGTTGEMVKLILAAARTAGAADGDGGEVPFDVPVGAGEGDEGSGSVKLTLEVPEGVSVSQPSLQRLRRKFTQIQKGGLAHGQGHVSGKKNIVETFAQFIQAEWAGSA